MSNLYEVTLVSSMMPPLHQEYYWDDRDVRRTSELIESAFGDGLFRRSVTSTLSRNTSFDAGTRRATWVGGYRPSTAHEDLGAYSQQTIREFTCHYASYLQKWSC